MKTDNEQNDYDKETERIQLVAKNILEKISCKKCNTKSIWYNIIGRKFEYDFCCIELEKEIRQKLINAGCQGGSATFDGKVINDNS